MAVLIRQARLRPHGSEKKGQVAEDIQKHVVNVTISATRAVLFIFHPRQ